MRRQYNVRVLRKNAFSVSSSSSSSSSSSFKTRDKHLFCTKATGKKKRKKKKREEEEEGEMLYLCAMRASRKHGTPTPCGFLAGGILGRIN